MNAFVTLVMKNGHYVNGALVMAYSLKLTKTKYPVICMTTTDIYYQYKNLLEKAFDQVMLIPYINYKTLNLYTKKQNEIYKDWKDISFTKWNCLNLSQYNKICLLDADIVIQKNIDHLFNLQAPAGCFGNNWDSKVNYYDEINYGEIINNKILQKGLNDGYIVNGHCIVLEPSSKIYNKFINFMKLGNYKNDKKCISMTDEVALVKFFIAENKPWTQIDKRYNCIPWKNNNIDNQYILHYFNKNKPWQLKRNEWDDLKYWYKIWDLLCKKFPELVNSIQSH
jgi:alpha-N-acetylglucosamine transferase